MSYRRVALIATLWLLSLVAMAAAVTAQVRPTVPLPEPKILSGADVGFRVEAMHGQTPVGSIVIRVNGEWVTVQEGDGSQRPRLLR